MNLFDDIYDSKMTEKENDKLLEKAKNIYISQFYFY